MSIGDKFKEVLSESSLSRIWQYIENDKGNFGIVSAFSNIRNTAENAVKHSLLKAKIREKGYGFVELEGGVTENGVTTTSRALFIPNVKKTDLLAFGMLFQDDPQDSVIFKDKFEFTEIATADRGGTQAGNVLNKFVSKSGKENLELSKELLNGYYSSLAKGGHKGKPFSLKVKESIGIFEIDGGCLGKCLGGRTPRKFKIL
jgi:hypothetical protein